MHSSEYIECLAGLPREHPLRGIYFIAQYEWFSGMAYDMGQWDSYHTHVNVENLDYGARAVDFILPFFKERKYTKEKNIWLLGDLKYSTQILHRTITAVQDAEDMLKSGGLKAEQEYELVVCAVNEREMQRYREFGSGSVIALSGPGTVAFNMDMIEVLGIDSPVVLRAMCHEPRHNVVREILPPSGNERGGILMVPGDYHDSVSHEAFGGLTDFNDWNDVDHDPRINFSGLEKNDFWGWYRRETSRLGHGEMYFNNAVAKAFHTEYVLGEGRDWNYWIQRVTNSVE